MQTFLALGCGALVGMSLGFVGGGGSVLALPLLLYVVGIGDAHAAIGTSAAAVAATAFFNLWLHARSGHVQWPIALVFAGAGVCGALVGSTIGKAVDSRKLLALFSVTIVVIAYLMQKDRREAECCRSVGDVGCVARLIGVGLPTGGLAGFFGIGGGLLVVPGLILAAGIPIIDAIGSSLVSVGAFSSTTAANYALSGLVDWPIAGEYVIGGMIGGWIGARSATQLAHTRRALTRIFGGVLVCVAAYTFYRSNVLASLQAAALPGLTPAGEN